MKNSRLISTMLIKVKVTKKVMKLLNDIEVHTYVYNIILYNNTCCLMLFTHLLIDSSVQQ